MQLRRMSTMRKRRRSGAERGLLSAYCLFVLLLRLFKSRRSRMIIGVLYSLLLVVCLFCFELWQIHLQLRVNPRTQDLNTIQSSS